MNEPFALTGQDRRILAALQADGRISNAELAERAGMSTSACWRRVRALEEAGVITGYAAQVDPRACGLAFHAIVHVQLARHLRERVDSFIRAMQARPEVQDCYATTGEADYHLRVLCRDQDAYNRFLESCLFAIEGVAHVRTNLVLREIKSGGPIGV
ncbi:MAG: Lrp/AsnC family transcriptional regulator [Alphaproteobacteria bacterium]|nr:MAG: Lrp/AsnC family transcriptional regulator [Alphaproteobacteria bacterium]